MAIKTTQPFSFESRLPNFERDIINATVYLNNNPLRLTEDEKSSDAMKYDIGHIVFDEYTKHHYVWLGETDGWGLPSALTEKVKFSDVDSSSETLYVDNIERDVATVTGNIVYVPLNGQPADWNERYEEYYIFNDSNSTYELNNNSTYDSNVHYYQIALGNYD